MKTKEDILEILAKNKVSLFDRFKASYIGLFGSYARGSQQEDSDVDILVEVDPSIGLDFVLFAEELEKLFDKKVDLVSKRGIKPSLYKIIEEDLIHV